GRELRSPPRCSGRGCGMEASAGRWSGSPVRVGGPVLGRSLRAGHGPVRLHLVDRSAGEAGAAAVRGAARDRLNPNAYAQRKAQAFCETVRSPATLGPSSSTLFAEPSSHARQCGGVRSATPRGWYGSISGPEGTVRSVNASPTCGLERISPAIATSPTGG